MGQWTQPVDIETFAHLVAHDLKAPLNGVARIADIVVEDYAERLDDDGRDQLRLLQAMAVRGVALVDALKIYARTSSAPVRPRTVDLGRVAPRLMAEVAARVAGEAVVETAIGASLPLVNADPHLTNLLLGAVFSNAVTFSRRPVRRVRFEHWPAPSRPVASGHVAFVVRDDGCGMPAAQWDVVFDLFRRLHAADKFGGGAGAGLALARLVVERHGGAIWIAASDDQGTALAFTLPESRPTSEG